MAECPGVYRLSLMRDGAMARIRVPGGEVTTTQLRTIGELARTYGNGLIDLTNRANLQVRGLGEADGPVLTEALQQVGLLTKNPDADRLRNITASPLAGFDATEILDVRPHTATLDTRVQLSPDTQDLSVKFAIVIDGGGHGSLRGIGHDIGLFAREGQSGPIFELSLAGEPTSFAVPQTELEAFMNAILSHLAKTGAARMRDALNEQSATELLAQIGASAPGALVSTVPGPDSRPGTLQLGHRSDNLTIGIPLARLTSEQIHGLADLTALARGIARFTPWQSIILPQAPAELLPDAQALGFDIIDPAVRIVACAGASGCVRTNADTKADGLRLRAAFAGPCASTTATQRTIHLSGCPRGCAQGGITPDPGDILALAQPESANYALHAGSRPSTAGPNPPLRSCVSAADLPAAVRDVLDA